MLSAMRGAIPPIASAEVSRFWSGALKPTSFVVVAEFDQRVRGARLRVSTSSAFSVSGFATPAVQPKTLAGALFGYQTFRFPIAGLAPNTTYYCRIEALNEPTHSSVSRSVLTAPTAGVAAAFTFVATSCTHMAPVSTTNQQYQAFIHRSMASQSPLFHLHLDDMSYTDPSDTTPLQAREFIARRYLRHPDVDALCRTVPIAYIPGDHDMAGNDSDLALANGEAIMRATRQAYQEIVPAYDFVSPSDANGIPRVLTQVFDIAKWRFLLLDNFSQARTALGNAMGSGAGNGDYWDQRTWFQQQLAQAAVDGMEWYWICNPRGWMDYNQHSYTDWFTAERTWICDQIEEANIKIGMIHGDTHATGFDDGVRAGSYSTTGFSRFPLVCASGGFSDHVGSGSTYSWNGTPRFYNPNNVANDGSFVKMTASANNKHFTAVSMGQAINQTTFAPSTTATVSSSDAASAVSFNNAAPSVAHGVPLTVDLNATWFETDGPRSVHWASSDGQSGDVTFKPNKGRASFSITFAAAGSKTITLSGAVNCTIGGTNPVTVTVS